MDFGKAGDLSPGPTASFALYAVDGVTAEARSDRLVVEEPLEIRVRADFVSDADRVERATRTLSVTMRTPGVDVSEDAELALGFLYSEGVVRSANDVLALKQLEANVVEVELLAEKKIPWRGLERHVTTNSACGVCGKSALDALSATPSEPLRPAAAEKRVDPAILHQLPAALRAAQLTFQATGALHAAGLFDFDGRLLLLREDVGRHNAVDKLIGAKLREGALPLHGTILLVSGRASFELVQKARMACIPILVAVGGPSSSAVALAKEAGLTLIGFARNQRCNVYSAAERLALVPAGSR